VSDQRSRLLDEIAMMAVNAAKHRQVIHCAVAAAKFADRYPNCGLTVREIENEIIRNVGEAGGAAEIGDIGIRLSA
jgi:hypothetical protein